MKSLRDRLSVFHTTNNVDFTDYKNEAFDYLRDFFTVTKTVYIGYKKPVNALYFEVDAVNNADQPGTWTWSYWDGSQWLALDVYDATSNLTRSGFVQWERPDVEAETTVNSTKKYWYRIEQDTSDERIVHGIGALFCDAEDLKKEYAYLDQVSDPAYYINYLVAARDRLLDELNVSAWDIYNSSDAKKAMTYLTLSILFSNISDQPDDRWAVLADSYNTEYRNVKSTLILDIDLNDDGVLDEKEKVNPKHWRWQF